MAEVSSLPCNSVIPLRRRANINDASIKSVMLYGSETKPVTKKLEDLLLRIDRLMIQLMGGVTLRTKIPTKDLLFSSGLVSTRQVIKRNRPRIF